MVLDHRRVFSGQVQESEKGFVSFDQELPAQILGTEPCAGLWGPGLRIGARNAGQRRSWRQQRFNRQAIRKMADKIPMLSSTHPFMSHEGWSLSHFNVRQL